MPLHRLYGLVVRSDQALPAPGAQQAPDIVITPHSFRCRSTLAPNNNGYSYERRSDGSVHVSWSDLFDFVVDAAGRRIDVYAEAAHGDDAVTYLISQVLSVALLQRNIASLHASALCLHGHALVLLGESGFGKSTLTAALLAQGARLMTDDLLVWRAQGDGYSALPGAQRIKLAPDTAAALRIGWPNTPMLDGSGKHVYAVPDDCFAAAPVPLAGVLRIQPHAARAALNLLSRREATRALLAATFNPWHTERARLQELLLDAQQLAGVIPFYELAVPRTFAALDEVVALCQDALPLSTADTSRRAR